MSTAGVFCLVTNDGKQDRMLMATALLNDRLASIHNSKFAANQNLYGPNLSPTDPRNLPSLLDIEKTHILFTNAHFKPFAAIGFEYNKVNTSSGTTTLGSTIQFSIPQFGDFFHDIAFHVVLEQPTLTSTAAVNSNAPAMRWCAYPGERLLKKVQQEVNGNPLDEYTNFATVAHREYRVAPNKLTSWKRCVGQEEAEVGFVRQPDWPNSGVAPSSHRIQADVYTGNQTPSGQKTGSLEMFIPLLFWYNKDVRLAVPSVAIPYGQRFINIELATANEMVGLVPRGTSTWASLNGSLSVPTISKAELYINNIFMNPEVHSIYIKRVGFSLIRVHRQQTFVVNQSNSELLLQQLKWPVEYLFVGCKVKDYVQPSTLALMYQNLDCWDKYSFYKFNQYFTAGYGNQARSAIAPSGTATVAAGTLTLSATAGFLGYYPQTFAAETADTTFTGTSGGVGGPGQTVTAAALPSGSVISVNGVNFTTTADMAVGATTVTVTPATLAQAGTSANTFLVHTTSMEVQTKSWFPTVSSFNVSAHGIDIYKEFPTGFFNAYTTYHYGGPNINSPTDVGSLFVPFCLYPGTYQPSGHINISRAREFYVKFTAANGLFTSSVNAILVVIASAINFLLISDGSAVLRYST